MNQARTVVLGVSGSIAAYKALEVTSTLVQAGISVRVIMTEAASRFVTPLSFESICHHPVLQDLWAEQPDLNISHIRLAQSADVLAIMPASADVLARIAQGHANDALTATTLACRAPLVLAPAMNPAMWTHPATQANLEILRARGATIIGPATGYLAEGSSGVGRLADITEIVEAIEAALRMHHDLAGRRVVVSAGPTREAIDPVRFLSNRSSGKMGYAIAEAARDRGAEVTLISGPVHLPAPHGIRLLNITSAQQMLDAIQAEIRANDTLVMAAAVADYAPLQQSTTKLKRSHAALTIELAPTPDVLLSLRRPPGLRVVAFAAETEDLLTHAQAKLAKKGAILLVANDISEPGVGFDAASNHVWLLRPGMLPQEVPKADKRAIAATILDAAFADSNRSEA